MPESGKTKGLFVIGIGLILAGAAIYVLLGLFGVGLALQQASADTGVPVWGFLIIPGLVLTGLIMLLVKVVIDRLGNAEDDHYSKTVDK